MVRQRKQWNELKRIILVSPGGAETPAERTKEKHPHIIPVELRYRAGDESEIRVHTLVSETRSASAESCRCWFLWASELCRTCSSCIYIVLAITPRLITTHYLTYCLTKHMVHFCIMYIYGSIGYWKGITIGDNDRLCN